MEDVRKERLRGGGGGGGGGEGVVGGGEGGEGDVTSENKTEEVGEWKESNLVMIFANL